TPYYRNRGRQMKRNGLYPRRTDWESIALPIILMITGIVLLAGNFFGFLSLERIQNLWPAAVIAIGVIELLPWCDHPVNPPRASAEARDDGSRDVPQVR
ncbi:MAG: hypothetical protein ACRD4O_09575, partial [Bryobacteraceae bacterium]